mmetsp:Transcript_49240/g.111701  ORF Transcript_49240/g.111701 Transcript_49240/m.111701 type:complete len:274 (-) Transcript_49240:115-936(-)
MNPPAPISEGAVDTERGPPRVLRDLFGGLDRDAVLASDDDGSGHAAEEAVVHDAHRVLELISRRHRVLDGLLEKEVDDVVAVVGHGGLVAVDLVVRARPQTELRLAPLERRKRRHLAHGVTVAEGGDLDGDGEGGAEAFADLRLVHDDDELLGAHLDHLLPQQRAPAALDQVEVVVHVVRPVDRHVELGLLVEGDEGDAQLLGLLLGPHAGRDRDDVLQLARLQELAQPLHRERRRRACAQADLHARLDVVVYGLVAHHLLELVLAQRRGHRR